MIEFVSERVLLMKFGHCAQFEELSAVKDSGYDFTELRGKAVAALPEQDFESLCQSLSDLELPCVGFNAYCSAEVVIAGPGYDRENTKRYARHLAARAKKLGIRQVGIGSPASRTLPEGFDRDLAATQMREFLLDSAECFALVNVRVALEPLAPFFCNFVNNYDEGMEYVAALSDNGIGLILDFLNMELSHEDDRDLRPLVPYVLHTHISDYDETPWHRDELKPALYKVHQDRLRRLCDAGYDGTVSIETDLAYDRERAIQTLHAIKNLRLR